jgi:hypothetical protein
MYAFEAVKSRLENLTGTRELKTRTAKYGDQPHDVMPRNLTVLDDLDDCVVALDAIKSSPVVIRFVRFDFG